MLSVIIPNRNGAATIEQCLSALFASRHDDFEVIVVDDCSTDDSVARIRQYPSCRLYQLSSHGGASMARNTGAHHSRGDILFFIDADCLTTVDTLALAEKFARHHGPSRVIGGTYTRIPADPGFFSTFQSVYINYCESKHQNAPDYIATHAMVIHAETFRQAGGFREQLLPIMEDVEFSHGLRRQGFQLIMEPSILVRHIFNFTLGRSLANALRKSRYWVCYSLRNHDVFADSGTASLELKSNVASFALMLFLALLSLIGLQPSLLLLLLPLLGLNAIIQRHLLRAFHETKGLFFAIGAGLYYGFVYPLAVAGGSIAGIYTYFRRKN